MGKIIVVSEEKSDKVLNTVEKARDMLCDVLVALEDSYKEYEEEKEVIEEEPKVYHCRHRYI